MNKAPNTKMMALGIGGIALLSLTGAYFLNNANNESQADLLKLEKELKDEDKITAQLAATQAKLAEYSSKLDHLEAGVPRSAYVPTLLAELETLGKQQGLLVTGVKPRFVEKKRPAASSSSSSDESSDSKKKSEEKKPYQELIIEVKCSGSYASVYKFVSALESFPKILGVTAVDIAPKNNMSKDKNATTATLLESTIDLRAYVFTEKPKDEEKGKEKKTEDVKTAQTERRNSEQTAG